MDTKKESPEYIRTSLAAAMTLGLVNGSFKDDVRLTGLNLLLTYENGCLGRCAYCGISVKERPKNKKTFIRVKWPAYSMDKVLEVLKEKEKDFERVCISMVTRKRALEDAIDITARIKKVTDLPVSLLISPTVIGSPDFLVQSKKAGADMIGVAIDAATRRLFDKLRGRDVNGPHSWDRYWKVLQWSAEVFGRDKTGVHLICGIGETDREMVDAILRAEKMGAKTHLFSFYPEAGTLLEGLGPPDLVRYRKIQIARYLINERGTGARPILFSADGSISGFNHDLDSLLSDGKAFMTSGCPCRDSDITACNRPLANERPRDPFRNYPHLPTKRQLKVIEEQIKGLERR